MTNDGFPPVPKFHILSPGLCSCPSGVRLTKAALLHVVLEPTCRLHQEREIAVWRAGREREQDADEILKRQDTVDRLREARAPAPPVPPDRPTPLRVSASDVARRLRGEPIPNETPDPPDAA